MASLQVSFGADAREALCSAFDRANTSIKAEFFDLSDRFVIESINGAARHGVNVELHVERHPFRYRHSHDAAALDDRAINALRKALDSHVQLVLDNDPHVLMHCKAAVVDDQLALISTGNPTWSGFGSDGEVLLSSQDSNDISDVKGSIAGQPAPSGDRVIAGPSAALRLRLQRLMQSTSDLRIASEGLSDHQIVHDLIARRVAGHSDHVVIDCERLSVAQKRALQDLQHAHVDVRALAGGYMHEKFVDDGNEIYLGSANLTRNGIDEGRELGMVAANSEFGPAAQDLEARFDAMWSKAKPASASMGESGK